MPELAEVETFKRYLDKTSLNQKIIEVIIKDNRILNKDEKSFIKAIEGSKFENSVRHGKYLFISMVKKVLVMHFGMTGDLSYFSYEKDVPPYSKVIFVFENDNALSYISQRMFGHLDVADSIEEYLQTKRLGPDALKMSLEDFKAAIKKRTTIAKNALMNQSIVSGIGNIYSDEILFQSRISPKAKINSLEEKDIILIYDKIKEVLEYGIKMEGDLDKYSDQFLIPHRNKEGICPTCQNRLERYELQGRHGFFCPSCQKSK